MNLRFQMIDTDTGELLANKSENLVCNFNDKKDRGFCRCLAWCQSAVRGIRCNGHDNIELRISFGREVLSESIPFQKVDGIEFF